MVLATCSGNRVSARTVSIVNHGLKIYFQTDIDFLKYKQIKENPNVALCFENIQIEGQATITCHPFENRFFIENYKIQHKTAFENYSKLKDNVIIEVEPLLITFWKYTEVDRKPYRDFIDIKEQKAYREYYQKPFDSEQYRVDHPIVHGAAGV